MGWRVHDTHIHTHTNPTTYVTYNHLQAFPFKPLQFRQIIPAFDFDLKCSYFLFILGWTATSSRILQTFSTS